MPARVPLDAPTTAVGDPSGGTSDRAVAKNMMTAIVGNAVPPAAALLSAPILAWALGVDGRGQLAAATAPLLLATTAATFGVPEAVTYTVARFPHLVRHALRRAEALMVLAGALATAGCLLAVGPLSGGDATIARLIAVASCLLVPALLVAVLRAVAAGLHRWRLVAAEQIVSALLRLAALAALAVTGHLTPLWATVVVAAMPVAGGVVYLPLLRRGRHIGIAELSAGLDDASVRGLMGFGMRIWIGSLSGIVLARLDQAIMTPLSSAYQLGLYAVAVNVSEVALVVNSAVRDVTFSADSASRSEGRLGRSARLSGALSLSFGLAIGLTLPWWLPILFGEAFRPAIPVCAILIAAVVLATPGSIAGAGLSARGRPGLRSTALLIASMVNVVALLVLVPRWGAVGAALATLLGNVLASNSNIFFLWRVSGVHPRNFYGLRRGDVQLVLAAVQRIVSGRRRPVGAHR